ncbi:MULTISPECIES: histidine phosphatase family protein [unclassified Chelatococcus]|uniref:SixA phosphatase family protein n=1 Tax=unclassified Chelatococcus TaxID=2638111 RepID=UPI001BCF1B98|nr:MULTISPECIES: histidine phosphatase family protein [unclassified Chelatococcus]MBS7698030.1 histidine phosphatase family protein [Chelatococcus sp. YT9]MBX3556652.1 histidine phosphatase family protein [Chelatococcus sp.]
MRRLVLLRHAKSDWPDGVTDHERPLAARGRKAAPLIASYMAAEKLLPDLVLVSSARRTQDTWALVSPVLAGGSRSDGIPMKTEPRIYEARVEILLAVLRGIADDVSTLLVVGHNPGMAELTLLLSGGGDSGQLADLQRKFPTAALSVIDFPGRWGELAPFKGRLDRFVTPKSLGGEDD